MLKQQCRFFCKHFLIRTPSAKLTLLKKNYCRCDKVICSVLFLVVSLLRDPGNISYAKNMFFYINCFPVWLSSLNLLALSTWSISSTVNAAVGPVTRELPGNFVGVICPVDFTDGNATAICRAKHSNSWSGKVFGTDKFTTGDYSGFLQGREPVWFGLPRCLSPELTPAGTSTCKLDTHVSRDCFTRTHAAGVLCSNNGKHS